MPRYETQENTDFPENIYGCGGNVFSSREKRLTRGMLAASPGSDFKQLLKSQPVGPTEKHNTLLLVDIPASQERFPLVAASEGPVGVADGSLIPLAGKVCSQVTRCHGCMKKVNTLKNKM